MYRLVTSTVTRMTFDGNVREEIHLIMDVESLIKESKLGTIVFKRVSRKAEILSVGPLQPDTIGLILCGCLWSFFKKYMTWVLVSEGGERYSAVYLSM